MPLLAKIPVFTSVISWNLRYGLSILESVKEQATPWVSIVDTSIQCGPRKALVILRLSLARWQSRSGAVTLEDCDCIGVHLSESWNGEQVSLALKETFERSGKPQFVIRDKGSDLVKGVELAGLPAVDDIGHELANGLKERFAAHDWFKKFLSTVTSIGQKIRLTDLAHLTPPKVRTKGRFQGISRVAEWASRMVELLNAGLFESDVSEKTARSMKELRNIEPQIRSFLASCKTVNEILKLLKDEGLTSKTSRTVRELAEQFSRNCPVKRRVLKWLSKHEKIIAPLDIKGSVPVSSDAIESLFGRFKFFLSRQPRSELNHLALLIPALCGIHDKNTVAQGLREISHADLMNWKEFNLPSTLERQRREVRKAVKLEEEIRCKKQGSPSVAIAS